MTDAMKKRLFGVGAVTVALAALGVIAYSNLGDSIVYYLSPTQLLEKADAQDAVVRLGGMVVPGSYKWDQDTQVLEFDLSDTEQQVHVVNAGNPPQMFREGIGAVVEGKLQADGTFHSSKVMVKHDNQYQAPKGHETEGVYANPTLDGESS
ncbi:MAG: cytochrome c maturation protein CcmE [Myxococcota bacterium]